MLLSCFDDFFLWNSERPTVRVPIILMSTPFSIMKLRYHLALLDQPQKTLLPEEYRIIVPAVLFITGQMFVITSTWVLGITGTFLGDYFGILMDHRVEEYVQPLSFEQI
jgi:Phospholipid methyltransferase